MSETKFLELMFDGGRFAAHVAPVDVLAELSTVEELIARVVRHLYFQRHPTRSRIAHGFFAASRLYLTSTEKNCFTAGLERSVAWAGAEQADLALFDEARDLSIASLRAVASGGPLPPAFPQDGYDLLAALGRRLDSNEKIIIRNGVPDHSATVDQTSRARLATMIHRPLETIEEIEGEVEKVDDASQSFTLRSDDGEQISGIPFTSTQRTDVVAALLNRPVARVVVKVLLTKGRTKSVTRVEGLEVLDDDRAADVQRVWERLEALKGVPDGWLEGSGYSPKETALVAAREVLARLLVDSEVPRPSVFPTPDGGVQAEWTRGAWAAELIFAPSGSTIDAEATNASTGEDRTETFAKPRVSREDTSALATWLREVGIAHV
jgi:hypothetical protein